MHAKLLATIVSYNVHLLFWFALQDIIESLYKITKVKRCMNVLIFYYYTHRMNPVGAWFGGLTNVLPD